MLVQRKIRTCSNLLRITQSGGKMSKRLGDIIGCKYKTSSWHLNGFPYGSNTGSVVVVVVVVVVVDSHIQRIVLATEETTVTQQVSHRPIKCQSRLWSQRGSTKVNGSHHGDNPLLRPTGIQIATKSYAALQAMAPTLEYRGEARRYTVYRYLH